MDRNTIAMVSLSSKLRLAYHYTMELSNQRTPLTCYQNGLLQYQISCYLFVLH